MRIQHIGDQNGVERIRHRIEILKYRQADEFLLGRSPLHYSLNLDALLKRAERSDFRQISLTGEQHLIDATEGRHLEKLRALGLGLTEKPERIRKILDREPRLLGKSLRRQVVRVTPRRCAANLDEPLLDATFEVGIDEAERDAEFGGEQSL